MTIVSRDTVLARYERLRHTGASHTHALEVTAAEFNTTPAAVEEIVQEASA